jgi:hypothetical protein
MNQGAALPITLRLTVAGNEWSSSAAAGRELRRIGKAGVSPNEPRNLLVANLATGVVDDRRPLRRH